MSVKGGITIIGIIIVIIGGVVAGSTQSQGQHQHQGHHHHHRHHHHHKHR